MAEMLYPDEPLNGARGNPLLTSLVGVPIGNEKRRLGPYSF